MNYNTILLLVIIAFTTSCGFIDFNEIKFLKPENAILTNRINITIETDVDGILRRSLIVISREIGVEHRAKSKIKVYENKFIPSNVFRFQSSKGVFLLRCDGPSAYGSWPLFPGGDLILSNGTIKKIIGDVSSGGKTIDSNKFVSESFFRKNQSYIKYGFRLIKFDIQNMSGDN